MQSNKRLANKRWKQRKILRDQLTKQTIKDQQNHKVKTHYDTVVAATEHMHTLPDWDGLHPLQVYVCPICSKFLIGHKRYT